MNAARRALLGLAFALGCGSASADTLVGNKGERLPGHLVEARDGKIVFMSDMLGRVEVSAKDAHVEAGASVQHLPNESAASTAAFEVEKKNPWSVDVGAKLSVDRGSLKTADDKLDTNLVLVHRTSLGELHGKIGYQYRRTENELRDDDWLASLGYDRFSSDRRFIAGRIMATRELTSEGYDATQTVSVASGWRLWETPEHFLRIGPALGYLAITRGEQRFDGPALGLYARAKTPLPGRSQLTGEMQLLDSLADGRYASLELRLRHPLGERLYIALGWDYVWSDFNIESGITSEWRWDIGWRFGAAETK